MSSPPTRPCCDHGEPQHLEPVDLILTGGEAELRFRAERTKVSGTAVAPTVAGES